MVPSRLRFLHRNRLPAANRGEIAHVGQGFSENVAGAGELTGVEKYTSSPQVMALDEKGKASRIALAVGVSSSSTPTVTFPTVILIFVIAVFSSSDARLSRFHL
jgi:hypothetical protein